MRGRRDDQPQLFFSIDVEHWIRPDHPLRPIKVAVDRILARSRYSRDQVHGKDPARELARMTERITRELGKEDAGREALEAMAEGVADAVEGRRPRWQAGPSPG